MKLAAYLDEKRGRCAQVARDTGLPPAFVSQMASGVRTVNAVNAIAIERATQHQVRVWDLRPHDWHLIWPHLAGTDGAPPVPNPATPANDTLETRNAA